MGGKNEMTMVYISHSGTLGQKWGNRKYQNPDGTWTEAGKARRRAEYAKSKRSGKSKVASVILKGASSKPQNVTVAKSQPAVQPQKPAQSKKDDYINDMIKEEQRTAEDLRKQRQDALELAEYRARIAEFNKRTVEANTRIKELTVPKEAPSTFDKYFAPALANAANNFSQNASRALGEAFIKKLTGPKEQSVNVTDFISYDKDGNVVSRTQTIKRGPDKK